MSATAGVRSAVESSVARGVDDAFAKFFERQRQERERLIAEHMATGEQLHGYQVGETQVPLLLRILPFVPDRLTEPTLYLIAVTSQRLLIVRIVESSETTGRLVAAIPFDDLEAIVPTSEAVTITTRSGRRYQYGCLTAEAPTELLQEVNRVRGAAV